MIHRIAAVIALAVVTAVLAGAASGADGPGGTMAQAEGAAATQRRSMRLLAYNVATSSEDSSTNTTPPEFANPTRHEIRPLFVCLQRWGE